MFRQFSKEEAVVADFQSNVMRFFCSPPILCYVLTAVPCEDAGDEAAGGAGRVHEAGQLLGRPEDGARQQPVQRPAVTWALNTDTIYFFSFHALTIYKHYKI